MAHNRKKVKGKLIRRSACLAVRNFKHYLYHMQRERFDISTRSSRVQNIGIDALISLAILYYCLLRLYFKSGKNAEKKLQN